MNGQAITGFRLTEGINIDELANELNLEREDLEQIERHGRNLAPHKKEILLKVAADKNSRCFFPERLLRIRSLLNITQEKLAPLFGTHSRMISAWETGRVRPSVNTHNKLRELEQVPVEDLKFRTGLPSNQRPQLNRKKDIKFKWAEVERLMELQGIKSRDKLAQLAGVHRMNLYKVSKGTTHPSLATLGKICDVLNCQPGDLLGSQEDFMDDVDVLLPNNVRDELKLEKNFDASETITELQNRGNLTLKELADLIGVSLTSIKRWKYKHQRAAPRYFERMMTLCTLPDKDFFAVLQKRRLGERTSVRHYKNNEADKDQRIVDSTIAVSNAGTPRQKEPAAQKLPREGKLFYRKKHRAGSTYLEDLRKGINFSQSEMANLLQLNVRTLHKYETGSLNMKNDCREKLKALGLWVQEENKRPPHDPAFLDSLLENRQKEIALIAHSRHEKEPDLKMTQQTEQEYVPLTVAVENKQHTFTNHKIPALFCLASSVGGGAVVWAISYLLGR